jgi:RNA polymerase sigma-B factor
VAELAEFLCVDTERVVDAMAIEDVCHPRSLNGLMPSLESDQAVTLEESLGAEDSEMASVEVRVLLKQALARLAPRLRKVIALRFYEGLSQKSAASRLGVSQMQVSRLERRALDQLRSRAATELDGLVPIG